MLEQKIADTLSGVDIRVKTHLISSLSVAARALLDTARQRKLPESVCASIEDRILGLAEFASAEFGADAPAPAAAPTAAVSSKAESTGGAESKSSSEQSNSETESTHEPSPEVEQKGTTDPLAQPGEPRLAGTGFRTVEELQDFLRDTRDPVGKLVLEKNLELHFAQEIVSEFFPGSQQEKSV